MLPAVPCISGLTDHLQQNSGEETQLKAGTEMQDEQKFREPMQNDSNSAFQTQPIFYRYLISSPASIFLGFDGCNSFLILKISCQSLV